MKMIKNNQEEFIKKCCDYADGFGVFIFPYCTQIQVPFGRDHCVDLDSMACLLSIDSHLYGYLLHRAIEGVNKKFFVNGAKVFPWSILNTSHGYRVYNGPVATPCFSADYEAPCDLRSVDQAKEKVLRYVFEQEKNNE